MFSDPQSITVDGNAKSLPRIGVGPNGSDYASADGAYGLAISHQRGKRNRRVVRLNFSKVASDPLLDGVSKEYTMAAYVVIDHPTVGYTAAEVEDNVIALADLLKTTNFVLKVVGGES
jgi:hypothetical protein